MQRNSGPADSVAALDEIINGILTTSRVLVGVSARSLADIGVTPAQFRTLVVLSTHGNSRMVELAERLGVGPSTALRSVDRLEAAGFVERMPAERDRREVVVGLTGAGRELVARVTHRRREQIEAIVTAMPEHRRQELLDALGAFAAFAAAAEEPPVVDYPSELGW